MLEAMYYGPVSILKNLLLLFLYLLCICIQVFQINIFQFNSIQFFYTAHLVTESNFNSAASGDIIYYYQDYRCH